MSGSGRPGPAGGRKAEARRPAPVEVDEVELRATVADLVGAPDEGVDVVSVSREPSPYATLSPADVLRVALGDGSELRLFLKHLGDEESDHPDKAGPEKEVLVYRDLLRDGNLPVARYYGARRNHGSGRHELYLEFVDGWNLAHHGLETWYVAARELGRLHAWFADRSDRLAACPVLRRLGAEYAWTWADRAAREAARRSRSLGDRVRALVARYEPVASTLEEAPATLVHNDLSPKNVVAVTTRRPTRIHFVDWESAGIGTGLLDLTNLSYGLGDAARVRMREAYFQEVARLGGPPPDEGERAGLEAACECHKALWRLAHSGAWGLPDRSAWDFAREAERAAQRLAGSQASPGAG